MNETQEEKVSVLAKKVGKRLLNFVYLVLVAMMPILALALYYNIKEWLGF